MSIGILCLGFTIGTLVGWYINESNNMSFSTVSGAIYLLAGSGVLAIFYLLNPGSATREYWFYPIGIFVGFFAAPFFDRYYTALYDKPKGRKKV
jgi:hypothetical protein